MMKLMGGAITYTVEGRKGLLLSPLEWLSCVRAFVVPAEAVMAWKNGVMKCYEFNLSPASHP